jgi:polar amino acid transport system substrate-binding protein
VDILSLCTYHNRFNYFKSHIKNDIPYTQLEDLKGYTIGDVIGSHLEGDFTEAGLTVDLAPTLEQGLKKLVSGRIDIWVAVGLTAYFLVETNFPERVDDLAFLEKPAGSGTVDVSFFKAHREYEKMKALYEKGLQIIRENGTYQEILERYFGKGVVFEDALSSCS